MAAPAGQTGLLRVSRQRLRLTRREGDRRAGEENRSRYAGGAA